MDTQQVNKQNEEIVINKTTIKPVQQQDLSLNKENYTKLDIIYKNN